MTTEQATEIIKILREIGAGLDSFAIIGLAMLGLIAGLLMFRR